MPLVEVFVHEDEDGPSIGLVLCDPAIVEYADALVPGCALTPTQAQLLAAALTQLAEQCLEAA